MGEFRGQIYKMCLEFIHCKISDKFLNISEPWFLHAYRNNGLPQWCRFDPWVGKIPEGMHGNPLQYSCLESPMDRGAWQSTGSQRVGYNWSNCCLVVSNSLWPHGLQHSRLSCPSPTPGACSNSCPSGRGCHALLSPSAFSHSQHQGLFKWICSSHQVAKVLEFQLQHQSFQCIFRADFL